MGASWSKGSWFGSNSPSKDGKCSSGQSQKQPRLDPRRLASQFVYTRRGSMFYDEDGDLAHEFYEEVKINSDSQKTTMRKKLANLRPQGTVYYPNPRLHVDFPIPMYSPIEK